MTLRRRLALVCAAAVAVVVVLGSVVAYALVKSSLRAQIDDSLRSAVPRLERVHAMGGPRGDVTVPSVDPLRGPLIGVRRAPSAAGPVDGEQLEDRTIEGRHVRVLTATLADGSAMQVFRPLEEVDSVLGRLRLGLFLLVLVGIAGAAVLGRLAASTAVQPVAELTAVAEHVAATQDLSRRIGAGGEDELGRLARSFDTMLEALSSSRSAQRQLVADASHELRTPLTSLRTNLEVLADGDALDAEDRERLRADLVAQLEELSVLVGDLVDLAREDEPVNGQAEDVALDDLVRSAVERARRHSPDVGFLLDAWPAVVRGDRARLDRAISNLLDNAAKFGGGAGPVEVTVRGSEVRVRDHGPGIPEADVPHVFDRFYRSDGARGRPGSGLGLAIVRQVAEAHGGSVRAEAAAGGGALLVLRLSADS